MSACVGWRAPPPLGPSRKHSHTTNLLDVHILEMPLEAFHQSGSRVSLVVQSPPRIEPAHQCHGGGALQHIALHQRRTKQPAAWIEQGLQMLENHALVWPRCRQAMHHIVQGDGVEAAHIEHDRLQHIGPINLRVVACDASRGARETVGIQIEQRDARGHIRKSGVIQKIAGPHPNFEMIAAQVLAVRGENALVRATPYPGTQTAQNHEVVERQTGAGECGLSAVRGYRTHLNLIGLQSRSRPLLLGPNNRAMPLPNLMSAVIFDRGKTIIWSYQRLRRSTKSNISLRRSSTTGSTSWSPRVISMHSRSAAAAGSSSRAFRPAAIRDTRFQRSVSAV